MTVAGSITAGDVPPPGRLVPASKAQPYIARLEADIARLDGSPVYLIDDGESGTSEDLIMETNEALWEERPVAELPLVILLERCFKNNWNFRAWLATNDSEAHVKGLETVGDLRSALEAVRKSRGMVRHAR